MFGSIGMPEMIIILVIALIIFGPRKLPELGRSLGRSINEFKKASNELRSTLEEEIRVEERKEQLYENLRDLNFEYRAGKYPEEDFVAQRTQLENETAQLLAEIDYLEQQA